MLFLIRYNRESGLLESLKAFTGGEREFAENARLDLELSLANEPTSHEIILLESPSEAVLRRTHRRYFEGTSLSEPPAKLSVR